MDWVRDLWTPIQTALPDAYREALEVFEAALGPDHPNTQFVRDNLQSLPTTARPTDPLA